MWVSLLPIHSCYRCERCKCTLFTTAEQVDPPPPNLVGIFMIIRTASLWKSMPGHVSCNTYMQCERVVGVYMTMCMRCICQAQHDHIYFYLTPITHPHTHFPPRNSQCSLECGRRMTSGHTLPPPVVGHAKEAAGSSRSYFFSAPAEDKAVKEGRTDFGFGLNRKEVRPPHLFLLLPFLSALPICPADSVRAVQHAPRLLGQRQRWRAAVLRPSALSVAAA